MVKTLNLKRVWKNETFDENCLDISNKFKRLLYRRTDDNLLPDESVLTSDQHKIQFMSVYIQNKKHYTYKQLYSQVFYSGHSI